eukprot:153155_1
MGEAEEDRKCTIYIGGFSDEIDEKILHSAFEPFGEVTHIQIPIDAVSEKHRGFGFLEFEDPSEAEAAIDNMHRAELYGRVIRVNQAKPVKFSDKNRPVWAQTDEYLKELNQDRRDQKQKRVDEEKARENRVETKARVPVGPTLPNMGV